MRIFEKSDQSFAETALTYSEIWELFQHLLSPPEPPQFGFKEDEEEEEEVLERSPEVVGVRYSDIKFTLAEEAEPEKGKPLW